VLNLMLLMGVSFVPFSTAVLATHLEAQEGRFVATLVYGGTFLFTAVFFNAIWHYAAWNRRLLFPKVSDTRIRKRSIRYIFGPVFYGLTLPVAIVSPLAALGTYVFLAAIYLLPIEE
jgi:uncharacterized membrane protein